jgi:hypothetical protein
MLRGLIMDSHNSLKFTSLSLLYRFVILLKKTLKHGKHQNWLYTVPRYKALLGVSISVKTCSAVKIESRCKEY